MTFVLQLASFAILMGGLLYVTEYIAGAQHQSIPAEMAQKKVAQLPKCRK